ncbi:twin-arginine translocase subunit TatC [Actinocatenispora rupis]|uniref:Sec-independent protein translocase protein TatC n=1 Tax=Actinocatenispora rupis TaxID=519421 RepID=A0A8J3J6S5_9ACTN|nr:twin-arginine translocase subunit TatC [Actinocatenispora rupis]GID11124.1 Sec-independent protein translocase protein TatC [Actinocatenispora rupis]
MSPVLRRRRAEQFERAADGSMPLMEHLRELRSRLFKAALAILVGFIIGYAVHTKVLDFLVQPYCDLAIANRGKQGCDIVTTAVTSYFVVGLKLALYIGLVLACPVWLYQLWAFIAPGLHANERRWAYGFVGVAVPLFAGGVTLAYLVVARGLEFLLPSIASQVKAMLDVSGYIDFMTKLMVVFGLALEFPLILALLNAAGILSAKRLLGWWRIAVFLMFVISAVVTPTPDPFGMTALAIPMVILYFGAVGFSFLNDRRKARKLAAEYGEVDDDEASELEYTADPVDDLEPIGAPEPIAEVEESPRDRRRRFDDST